MIVCWMCVLFASQSRYECAAVVLTERVIGRHHTPSLRGAAARMVAKCGQGPDRDDADDSQAFRKMQGVSALQCTSATES